MFATRGKTLSELNEIHVKIDACALGVANHRLEELIKNLSPEELLLVSSEIKELIDRFHKKKKKSLSDLLQRRLTKGVGIDVERPSNEIDAIREQHLEQYNEMLHRLEDSHIFQWATYYRSMVGYIYKDLNSLLEETDSWQASLDAVAEQFSEHCRSIAHRGVQYSLRNGFSIEVANFKTMGGMQQFLYIVINLYLDHQEKIYTSKQARLARDIASSLITGILEGYAATLGWELLYEGYRKWVPALAYVNGVDGLALLRGINNSDLLCAGLFNTVAPALIAIDQISNMYHGHDMVCPRLSRVSLSEPARLEISLRAFVGSTSSEISISCIFGEVLSNISDAEVALLDRASIIIVRANSLVKGWLEGQDNSKLVDSSEVSMNADNARDFAEIIKAGIMAQIKVSSLSDNPLCMTRNYASEFPLDDPDFRRLFTIERNSVKMLLEQFDRGNGVHLWCSVRRSGKTTAASSLADITGRAHIIFQTMDHVPHHPEQNIFERKFTEALISKQPLAPDFFESVVNQCAVSDMSFDDSNKKIIFVLDEYESLFGMLAAMADADQKVRYFIAQPLLSQMVGFATKNLLIFMGQRPDAHYILSAQNQLSPLVRPHKFPLFEHHAGMSDTEFGQFVKRVLSPALPIDTDFIAAVHDETSGHPYLTVNLMVDFCDWLISNKSVETSTVLNADLFNSFTKDRLSPAALSRSTFYPFFFKQLSEYLSEKSRVHEPWLYAIASVLHQIGRRHPRKFSCTIVNYKDYALKASAKSTINPQQLLSDAVKANFLSADNGHVRPAIKLMARLAACSIPEID